MKTNIYKIVLVIIAATFGIIYIKNTIEKENDMLQKNHAVQKCLIRDVKSLRAAWGIYFTINDNGKEYYNIQNAPLIACSIEYLDEFANLVINKSLYIVYERGNPKNNKVITNFSEAQSYNIKLNGGDSALLNAISNICDK